MIISAGRIIDAKLRSMTDDDIRATWEALRSGWGSRSFWDAEHDISMDDWAEAVYSEKSERGI